MDEPIRGRIHDALGVEPPPPGLRARVIASVPMPDRTAQRLRPRFERPSQFAAGFVGGLVAVAVVASLLYSRQALTMPSQSGPNSASPPRLIAPEGIAVAPDGTVYVSDYDGNRVFRLLPGGGLASVAGGGVGADGPADKAHLWGPSALAFDPKGNLYVADSMGGAVRRIDRQGVMSTVTSLYGAQGLAFDSTGVLYVGSYYGVLRRVGVRGETTDLDLSKLPSPIVQFGNMAFAPSGDLYVTDRAPVTGVSPSPGGGCRILRLKVAQRQTSIQGTVVAGTGTCGFSGDGGPATSAQLNDPSGIVFDVTGNLYLSDAGNHRIRRIDKDGVITTVAGTGVAGYRGDGGPATRAQLTNPFGLAITSSGLIYIADPNSDPAITPARVRVFRVSDGTIATVAGG